MMFKTCECNKTITREKIFQNGTKHVGEYCAHCGRWLKWLSQNKPLDEFQMAFG